IHPPPDAQSNGLWFRDPDGTPIEIRVAEKSSPNEKSSHESISSAPGVAGAPSCSTKPVVRPRRLAHILVFTRDVPKTIKFYGEVLGVVLRCRLHVRRSRLEERRSSARVCVLRLGSDAAGRLRLQSRGGGVRRRLLSAERGPARRRRGEAAPDDRRIADRADARLA